MKQQYYAVSTTCQKHKSYNTGASTASNIISYSQVSVSYRGGGL